MASTRTFLCLLVIVLLGFSHLNISNAIPTTRIGRFMHGNQDQLPSGTTDHLESSEKIWDERTTITERMDAELNDYPGSGANNRHTPKP